MSFGDISPISLVPGGTTVVMPSPKNLMSGIRTRYDSTPPAHMTEAIFGPMIYPTPSNSGEISAETEPALNGAPKNPHTWLL